MRKHADNAANVGRVSTQQTIPAHGDVGLREDAANPTYEGMAGEWSQRQFGDCAMLVRESVSPADSAGVPYIGLEHIAEGALSLLGVGTAEDVTSLKSRFRSGDILFGKLRPYFRKVIRAPFDGVCSTDIWVVRPKNNMDTGFIFYWMASQDFVDASMRGSEGTKMPRAKWDFVARISHPVPSLPEQKSIAHILGTLDDKIELNRRMNETLEAMARALFKSWFVDFDPVRAKAEGRDPGLPKPLADQFPDSFEDSELGEIPKGWKVGSFGDVVEQLRDQENPLSSPDVLFHHYSLPAFDDGQSPKIEHGESIKSLKLRVPAGVILLSKLNPEIERVWMVDVHPGERAVCSTEFLVLRTRTPFVRNYVYCLTRSPIFRQQIESLVTGTSKSHQRAQVDSILNLAVVVPPSAIVVAFERCATGLLERTFVCRREARTLAVLRDTLLPRLISGELRVKDTECFVESTV